MLKSTLNTNKQRYVKTLQLERYDVYKLNLPVKGSGGMQSLIRKIRDQISLSNNTIRLTQEDIDRITKYAKEYGKAGGYQGRLSRIAMYLEADSNNTKLNEF